MPFFTNAQCATCRELAGGDVEEKYCAIFDHDGETEWGMWNEAYCSDHLHTLAEDVEQMIRQFDIKELEERLGELAKEFREATEPGKIPISGSYAQIISKLFATGQWSGEPDADSMLPEEYMSEEYKQHWKKKLADLDELRPEYDFSKLVRATPEEQLRAKPKTLKEDNG